MFVRPSLGAFLVGLLLLGPPSRTALASDSMRCGSRIVTVEARAADVLAACGDPDFRDVYSHPAPRFPGEVAEVEQWTYNFGRNQLLHVLRLRHGRLVDIRTDGYGFATAGTIGRCGSESIQEGLSKYRLLASCGQPFTRRTMGYVSALQPRHRHHHGGFTTSRGHLAVEVYREEWVYNFGSSRFLKVVTIEDGVVADVDNGERGFNPR